MKLPTRKESSIYKPALEWLNLQPGTKAWRSSNHAVYDPYGGKFRKKAKHELGLPDICGVKMIYCGKRHVGQAFAIECKRSGKLAQISPFQKAWMEDFVSRCAGVAYTADSLDDIMELWKEI